MLRLRELAVGPPLMRGKPIVDSPKPKMECFFDTVALGDLWTCRKMLDFEAGGRKSQCLLPAPSSFLFFAFALGLPHFLGHFLSS
jgi:hypothetical protein